jgi:GNAT superfamily N-acetyltransferase
MFDDPAYACALIVERSSAPVGFALYYFRYSSFTGRPSLWLDDLYVDAAERSRGIGGRLLAELRVIASARDCTHLAWTAAVNNPRGIAFYERAGAAIIDRRATQVTLHWATQG